MCSNSRNWELSNFSAIDYTEATVEWKEWAVEDSDSDIGEDMKLRVIRGLCKRLLVIMLTCWQVNEYAECLRRHDRKRAKEIQ